MATINFYLRDDKVTQKTPIILTVSYDGKRVKLPTWESILPTNWNKETQRPKRVKSFPEHPEFKTRLDSLETKVNKILLKFQTENEEKLPTPETLKEIWKKENNKEKVEEVKPLNFSEYFDKFIKDLSTRVSEKSGKPFSKGTIKTYVSLKNVLAEFIKQDSRYKKLDFKDFDIEFYDDFKQFLTEKKLMAVNTVGARIKNLKAVLNHAYENEVNTYLNFKKKRFKVTKEQTDAIYLSVEELNIIEQLDLSSKPHLDRVRDIFLIGCWTGVRFSDLKQIRPETIKSDSQGLFIEVIAQKTGNPVVIPILPVVQRILDKYKGSLPRPISNQKMNNHLKEIGQLAGLNTQESKTITKAGQRITTTKSKFEVMTTHTARRSFCTNNYLAGVSSITIMAISGHKSEKEFLRYIKVTPREHANLIRAFWNDQEGKTLNNIIKIAN